MNDRQPITNFFDTFVGGTSVNAMSSFQDVYNANKGDSCSLCELDAVSGALRESTRWPDYNALAKRQDELIEDNGLYTVSEDSRKDHLYFK